MIQFMFFSVLSERILKCNVRMKQCSRIGGVLGAPFDEIWKKEHRYIELDELLPKFGPSGRNPEGNTD